MDQSGDRVVVTGANYAKCNGEYELIKKTRGNRPMYKKIGWSRYIFWQSSPGYGWSIGPSAQKFDFFHNSNYGE